MSQFFLNAPFMPKKRSSVLVCSPASNFRAVSSNVHMRSAAYDRR